MTNIENFNLILNSFKIKAICSSFKEHKNAYFYDCELRPGGRIKDFEKFSTELSLALKAYNKPRISVLSEDGIVRLEFLKSKSEPISLLNLAQSVKRPNGKLTCLIGETLDGMPMWLDLVNNPHTLIAGCTGSGKSTLLHLIIANMFLYPNVKLYLMDPKNIEFFKYSSLHNDNLHITYSYTECLNTLQKLNYEMCFRYEMIRKGKAKIENFPYIVLIIDEFADLRLQDLNNEFYKELTKLAQKCRAARIHIILSTQRPTATVIDGNIKANFPARISCKVASGIDSKIILDSVGAEHLVGSGDAIINSSEFNFKRFQSAYITADEVCKYFV